MSKLKSIHPGEVLKEEFLKPLGITAYTSHTCRQNPAQATLCH